MRSLRAALTCVLLAVGVSLFLLVRTVTAVVAAMPAEIQATRGDLTRQVDATRKDLFNRTERQVTALRSDVRGEVAEVRTTADQRFGDTLARIDTALGTLDGLRTDLQPVLVSAAALTSDAKDSLDDLYPDVKASVESATVATNQLGQASIDFRTAVPGALMTWQTIGGNVQGITANINTITKPKWYDRLLGYGLNGVVIYGSLNPAGNLTVRGAQLRSL